MKNENCLDILIIGAGPSGLLISHYLKNSGLNILVIEKAATVGSSWDQMPDHLRLITFWKSNALIPEDLGLFNLNEQVSAKDFYQYLCNFKIRHQLPIEFDCEFVNFKKVNIEGGKIFEIVTKSGLYRAKKIIDCRVYFIFPHFPEIFLNKNISVPVIHFKDYKNVDQVKDFKRILIVGKGLSAGQLIEELDRSSLKFELSISTRSKIRYTSNPRIFNIFLRFLDVFEKILFSLPRNYKYPLNVPMAFTAKSIIEKRVLVFGDVKNIYGNTIEFDNELKKDFDLILLATGFQTKKESVDDRFESIETPGLFYLGLDFQKNYTSRFIRGMRQDAKELAKYVQKT
jgi:putative flavoprotein involved in K+ transport